MLAAMKAGEGTKLQALRLLKAEIMKFEVSGDGKKEASDEEVLSIIARAVKQRKDSIDAYRKGAREDLAVHEEAELKILQEYLPAQMGEEEVRVIVIEVIHRLAGPDGKKTGAMGAGDFGKVMGMAMKEVKGKTDGQMVGKVVKELLK